MSITILSLEDPHHISICTEWCAESTGDEGVQGLDDQLIHHKHNIYISRPILPLDRLKEQPRPILPLGRLKVRHHKPHSFEGGTTRSLNLSFHFLLLSDIQRGIAYFINISSCHNSMKLP